MDLESLCAQTLACQQAYNEGWGELPEEVPNTMQLIRSLAPNKLVNEASGWIFHGSGDFVDIHQCVRLTPSHNHTDK